MSETHTRIGDGLPLEIKLLGELELDLGRGFDDIFRDVDQIATDCGYHMQVKDNQIIVKSGLETAKIIFDFGKVVKVEFASVKKCQEAAN